MLIRQSDLASWSRCPQQVHLSRAAREAGKRQQNLSASAFGTVIHHATQVLEELHHEGRTDACERAVDTFAHYWHPDNIEELVPGGVDVWLPRQTYGSMLTRGRDNLRAYYERLSKDTGQLLALEQSFTFPMVVPGHGEHTAHGTLDRLALRVAPNRIPYLSIEDYKSGQKPAFLRHAFQWTYYAWASLQPQFWAAWEIEDRQVLKAPLAKRGLSLYRDGTGRPIIPRRGRWIALRDAFGIHDCGWRTTGDFTRMHVALGEYIASNEAGIFPLNITGATCTYCPFAYDGSCGGHSLLSDDEGDPYMVDALFDVNH